MSRCRSKWCSSCCRTLMRLLRPSRTTLSFLLPTLVLPLGMLVASVIAMTQPVTVSPQPNPTPTEPVEPPPATRAYHAFLSPVTLSLPKNEGTLSIQIGVALPQTFDRALEKTLQDKPDALLGNLATVIHDAIDTEGTDGDPVLLRTLLSEALLIAINANLAAMGEPPDILEVLIIDWALLQ